MTALSNVSWNVKLIVNISYIEIPKSKGKLKDNMWYTAEPFYKNMDIEFGKLKDLVKSDYIQITPYDYKHNQKNSQGWDNSKQNTLMLDIDDGMSLGEIMEIFKHHTYLIYTTKSHLKEKKGLVCDRFRVILPADDIPTDDRIYFTMLRLMRLRLMSDEQTETKTGSFLGNEDCVVFTNTKRTFSCFGFVDLAERIVALETKIAMLEKEVKAEKRSSDISVSTNSYDLDPIEIKQSMDLETMIEIVETLEIEVTSKGKCSIREEGTPSTQLYADGGVHDFGGDSMDIFQLVMDKLSIDFPTSLMYVNNFIKE